jgi:hypothetical protein
MMVWVIELSVDTISAFAWNARCAVIMFTSCEVISTFDCSSAPD